MLKLKSKIRSWLPYLQALIIMGLAVKIPSTPWWLVLSLLVSGASFLVLASIDLLTWNQPLPNDCEGDDDEL